jgi:hypothetical protein
MNDALDAEVAELADALDSGSSARKGVGVRVPPSAPFDRTSLHERPLPLLRSLRRSHVRVPLYSSRRDLAGWDEADDHLRFLAVRAQRRVHVDLVAGQTEEALRCVAHLIGREGQHLTETRTAEHPTGEDLEKLGQKLLGRQDHQDCRPTLTLVPRQAVKNIAHSPSAQHLLGAANVPERDMD